MSFETVTIGPCTLIRGDCLAIMREMNADAVDHVITDPPFTQRTSQNMRSRRDAKDGGEFIGTDRRRIEFDGIDGKEADIATLSLKLARRWCIVWCALEQIGAYAAAAGESWIRGTVWARTNSAPQFTGDRPGQACEGVAIMHRAGPKRWNRGGDSLIFQGATINSVVDPDRGRFDHPTVKPLWLMKEAIASFTDEAETVLDPFMGSGTTGVACIKTGRQFIGIEIEPRYFDIACERIRKAWKLERSKLPLDVPTSYVQKSLIEGEV